MPLTFPALLTLL
ncbi:hypothetical protein E2C01_084095 [Portunus trituberculatus]|uniref:Uncharacterized protein n=1 Tax=Portunus trituberculatus TaxID=210409 RepID=A0A5B7IUD7_PORTR|nr:hypothetical protein [Portunus trituberculatus]